MDDLLYWMQSSRRIKSAISMPLVRIIKHETFQLFLITCFIFFRLTFSSHCLSRFTTLTIVYTTFTAFCLLDVANCSGIRISNGELSKRQRVYLLSRCFWHFRHILLSGYPSFANANWQFDEAIRLFCRIDSVELDTPKNGLILHAIFESNQTPNENKLENSPARAQRRINF